MRLSKLLMASSLILPLACGGDDGDDSAGTEAATTAPTTAADDGMMTTPADDDGVDDGLPTTGGDDGLPTTGGDDTPPTDESGSSSGMPPADSSGSGSESGSGSGGNASQECIDFCGEYIKVCGDNEANDYGDEAGCLDACGGYAPPDLNCRVMHLEYVTSMDDPSHCGHANIDGGGVC